MHTTVQLLVRAFGDGRLPLALMDAALKSTLLLSLAGVGCLLWRKASAATRHLIWFAAILGAICLPVLALLTPHRQGGLLRVGGRFDEGNQLTVVLAMGGEKGVQQFPQRGLGSRGAPGTVRSGERLASPWSVSGPTLKLPWLAAGMGVWCCGFASVLVLALVDRFRLEALRSNARLATDPDLLALLNQLCRALRLRRPVCLLESPDKIVPITWGSLRPAILLPVQARHWTGEQRRLVLLHELGHVKRWDCLTQLTGRLTCALYWFNPLVWTAARQLRVERERACDDLVLEQGIKPSEYAHHLVGIARFFADAPRMAGIAMARRSHLKSRVRSILEQSPSGRLGAFRILAIWLALGAVLVAISGNEATLARDTDPSSQTLLKQQLAQLKSFSAAKLKQSQELAARAREKVSPEFQRFFTAATSGDSQTVTNMYEDFKRRHPQYSHGTDDSDTNLSTAYWSPVLEICLAYDHVIRCDPKYTALLADGIINSIPSGSIYFGGTDPGRGIPTAFEKSQIDGEPFFVLTQNALADGTYLKYLRETYGGKIYTPTDADSQRCYNEYLNDALKRVEHDKRFPLEPKQVRPGENVRKENEHVEVSGQAAVMGINGLLAKLIVDRNPGRTFYLEESFPLEWMYPHLEPHGPILKINPEPLRQMPKETVAADRLYWHGLLAGMVGDWLGQDTPVKEVAEFLDKVYVRKDLAGFSGDRNFIQNDYAKRVFSKLRGTIAGVYAWRDTHSADPAGAQRMAQEADLAFRQAIVLCPYSPEALFRYANFLSQHQRASDALVIAAASLKVDPSNIEFQKLVRRLKNPAAGDR